MSKETLVEPTVNMTTVFAEGTILEREEVPMAIDTSMEGFFDGANIIAEAMASAIVAATMEVFAKSSIPSSKLISAEEDVSVEKKVVGESIPISAEFSTPSKGGVSPMVAQTKGVPFTTPLPIISASDPLATLFRVVGGGSLLVVTPSSYC